MNAADADRVTRPYAFETVAAALAAEACCSPANLRTEGVHLSELSPDRAANPLRRRYPLREESLQLVTMGTRVVVSATPRWIPWVTEIFRDVEPDEAFSPRVLGEVSRRVSRQAFRLHGPYPYNVTSNQDWRHLETPSEYAIDLGGAELSEQLNPAFWPNVISPRAPAQGRPNVVTAVAIRGEEVVGAAAASTDSDALWQIGVDVQPEHRGRGLGAVLTSRVAGAVLARGKVPFYGSRVDNIASRRTAQSAGFYPCWVAVYTTEE